MSDGMKLLAHGLELGEGPVWHAPTQTLWFVDITQRSILSLDTAAGKVKTIITEDMVGCVVPVKDGTLLAAVKNTLVRVNPETGNQTALLKLDLPEYGRFNDGKCDACGRLWVGTMAADQQDPRAKGCGSLYCVENGAVLRRYDGFTISNGMAWSADNAVFYHVDTPTQRVDAYDTSVGGELHNRRGVVTLDPREGSPDGMCIDAEGNLWIAMWGGGQVLCVSPGSGKILHRLAVPDKNVSCCTFGGGDMKTLFITTARDEKGQGGNLFAAPTRTTGVKLFEYGG